jgi:dienelactone hydrolase
VNIAFRSLLALTLAWPVVASAQLRGSERVEFPVAGATGHEQIFGHLFLPTSPAGSIPAVVIVHGSGGVGEGREGFWGRELAGFGVAALAIDSFRPRGVMSTVDDQSKITAAQMVRDAFGALVFLSKHPAIDANRVAIMGMSRGGAVALQAADERDAKSAGATFAAHVPLYPGCSTQYRNPRMRAPILMLIGADDDYTGVKPCAQYAERIRTQGGKVELKTYEGAHHGFDGELSTRRTIFLSRAQNYRDCLILIEDNGGATLANTGETLDISQPAKAIEILGRVCMKHGATVGFFATARERALEDVKAFLKAHLLK